MGARLIALGLLAACLWPAAATASPVAVLGHDGHVSIRQDPFVPAGLGTPRPSTRHLARAAAARAHGPARRRRHRRPPTAAQRIDSALRALARRHALTPAVLAGDLHVVGAADRARRRLRGTRAVELAAVLSTVAGMAQRGALSAARLPAVIMTIDRNRQWWTHGTLLGYGERVEFDGSELVWEYYRGQGIQLQPLASFGKADGLYTAGATHYDELRELLGELEALTVVRGGAATWEYYFTWEGGQPPWTSAMTQGTALEALTRGYQALADPSYLALAHRALRLFQLAPPLGVGVRTPHGSRYVQYSFAPDDSIINAFLQSLIGLYDYARVSGDATAATLFSAGDAEAQAELPAFDTGAWSLYQPGEEDSLDYHDLVTGFLGQLCTRTAASAYCSEAQKFTSYLHTPPALTLLTTRLRAGHAGPLRFRLSKRSHVGAVVTCGRRTVLYTSAWFSYGRNAFTVAIPRRVHSCSVRLAATGLAGNFARTEGTLAIR